MYVDRGDAGRDRFWAGPPSSFSGKRVKRIVVRNAMVVDGSGKPAAGPLDIMIENDMITRIVGFARGAADCGRQSLPRANLYRRDGQICFAGADQSARPYAGRACGQADAGRVCDKDVARVRHHDGAGRVGKSEDPWLSRSDRGGNARRAAFVSVWRISGRESEYGRNRFAHEFAISRPRAMTASSCTRWTAT